MVRMSTWERSERESLTVECQRSECGRVGAPIVTKGYLSCEKCSTTYVKKVS